MITLPRLPLVGPGDVRRGVIRHPDGHPPRPDGCRWCGGPYWGHRERRFATSKGLHEWEQPTEAQVEARRKARAAIPEPAIRCEAMNHNSVGGEVFCEIEDPHHDGDHDAGDDITWPRED